MTPSDRNQGGSIRELKQSFRKRMLAARDGLADAERTQASSEICRRLESLDEFDRARTVALFASFRTEVSLDDAIVGAIAAGKQVVLPLTRMETHALEFYPVASLDELVPGTYGIREPDPAGRAPADPQTFDLIVTPGAAFDPAGRRIGYGGGFYDGVLAGIRPDCAVVAVCFEVQIANSVPCEPHDKPVSAVVHGTPRYKVPRKPLVARS